MNYELNHQLAEVIGAIIGDGCIRNSKKHNQYYVEIVGDPIRDSDYFYNRLTPLIFQIIGKTPKIKIRERGIRLKIYSKEFVEFLVKNLEMPFNKDKGVKVKIPDAIIRKGWEIEKCCIRGITDTDGSLFLANKGYRTDYPTIEISSTSKNLAYQLKDRLKNKFRIGFRKHKPGEFRTIYRISINGDDMVKRWIKEIGFRNQRHLKKVQLNKIF